MGLTISPGSCDMPGSCDSSFFYIYQSLLAFRWKCGSLTDRLCRICSIHFDVIRLQYIAVISSNANLNFIKHCKSHGKPSVVMEGCLLASWSCTRTCTLRCRSNHMFGSVCFPRDVGCGCAGCSKEEPQHNRFTGAVICRIRFPVGVL